LAILSRPKYVFMGGKLRRWEEAMLHIGCEAVTRGLNVFEGVRGFWQSDGRFGIVMLRRHYERLRRSARLLHIPFHMTFEAYTEGIHELVGALVEPTRDMWARTTLYVTEGHWGEDTVADLVMTAYHMETRSRDQHLAEECRCLSSSSDQGRNELPGCSPGENRGTKARMPRHDFAQPMGSRRGGYYGLCPHGSGGSCVYAPCHRRMS
jgi:branched-subunit amino acid aminotransferase/4-amino-4-deoxychorismate lyase